jgi:alcohol dehydrogenase (cytochrome c)
MIKHALVGASFLLASLALPGLANATPTYSPVTDARLENPEPRNWLMYRRTYDSWGYSPLAKITARNVATLEPVWSLSTGTGEGHQAPPIVNDGMMFITTPFNQVLALDAKTGDVLWRYRHRLPSDLRMGHPTNRGVALYGDKLYMATSDAKVVALKAATGEVAWQTPAEDYNGGYYMTMAPLAARGKILVGVSGGERGIRGFVLALDAETGKQVWKTYTIPAPGEPGHDTWPEGDSWKTGGAPTWVTGSYDPQLKLTYWGTGNPGPWMGDARPGDNLYANSVIALDIDTGELKGYHQYHWNDSWDWDEVSAPLLVDLPRDGRMVHGLVHAARDGYLWFLERKPDAISFIAAKPFVKQNVFTSIDPKTGRPEYDMSHKPGTGKSATFCPSLWGGKDWPPEAYSPRTNYLYIPANENLCQTMEGEKIEYRRGQQFTGAQSDFSIADGADHVGELQAWNLATGERAWTQKFDSENWGPVLATGGGVLFAGGTSDRYFRAFDAATGKILWQYRTNSGITGVPTTFEVDGVQYVAVQSGWGVDAQGMLGRIDKFRGTDTIVPQGGVVWVFALRGR